MLGEMGGAERAESGHALLPKEKYTIAF
jgi:hypothetical protein